MRLWLADLHLGARQVVEERGHALVLVGLLAGHDPQAGAADHGVLRRARHVRVVRQRRDAGGELGVALDVRRSSADEPVTIAHSPDEKVASAALPRPL